mmetsp:Transcript_24269/g.57634  ORF Transcript_24269/g.57634 Transcript_24269/m.57634 type:complete len:205 (-) Transcript_24269:157-771(-)
MPRITRRRCLPTTSLCRPKARSRLITCARRETLPLLLATKKSRMGRKQGKAANVSDQDIPTSPPIRNSRSSDSPPVGARPARPGTSTTPPRPVPHVRREGTTTVPSGAPNRGAMFLPTTTATPRGCGRRKGPAGRLPRRPATAVMNPTRTTTRIIKTMITTTTKVRTIKMCSRWMRRRTREQSCLRLRTFLGLQRWLWRFFDLL